MQNPTTAVITDVNATEEAGQSGRCAQCQDRTSELTQSEHGPLCPRCAFRQSEHDDARERYQHLSPQMFGFAGEGA